MTRAATPIPGEIVDLDRRLLAVAPRVKILSRLSWTEDVVVEFLASVARGEERLPEAAYTQDPDLDAIQAELRSIRDDASADHPLARLIRRTADSYADGARLIQVAGTDDFVELSRALYGDPSDPLPGGAGTHEEAARKLLEVTSTLTPACEAEAQRVCLTPEGVRQTMSREVDAFFGEGIVSVVIDDALASKAAASARRIRLRGRTCFSEADVEQLLHHEAFLHSATALNGQAQQLQVFSLSAPRTTATQEGLATLSELVTGSMDLSRLRRIALRICGVRRALDGADFVELFRWFVENGQTENESAHSAMRVFRGGDPRGGIAFTKDVVYLRGLVGVHTFLRRAIREGHVELVTRLLVGRLTLRDTIDLRAAFDSGQIAEPRYLPRWAADPRRLASYLAMSLVWGRIEIEDVTLDSILETPD